MADVHPEWADPENYTGNANDHLCQQCEFAGPHQTLWLSGQIILFENGATDYYPEGSIMPGWLIRGCGRCGYIWPERTVTNPRPADPQPLT
jgi:hypothetical protein